MGINKFISESDSSFRPNTDKLYVFGGCLDESDQYTSDFLKKSNEIYCISTISQTIETLQVAEIYKEKAAISSAYTTWFSNNTLG